MALTHHLLHRFIRLGAVSEVFVDDLHQKSAGVERLGESPVNMAAWNDWSVEPLLKGIGISPLLESALNRLANDAPPSTIEAARPANTHPEWTDAVMRPALHKSSPTCPVTKPLLRHAVLKPSALTQAQTARVRAHLEAFETDQRPIGTVAHRQEADDVTASKKTRIGREKPLLRHLARDGAVAPSHMSRDAVRERWRRMDESPILSFALRTPLLALGDPISPMVAEPVSPDGLSLGKRRSWEKDKGQGHTFNRDTRRVTRTNPSDATSETSVGPSPITSPAVGFGTTTGQTMDGPRRHNASDSDAPALPREETALTGLRGLAARFPASPPPARTTPSTEQAPGDVSFGRVTEPPWPIAPDIPHAYPTISSAQRPISTVLVERQAEVLLEHRLERLLQREARRHGIDLEDVEE